MLSPRKAAVERSVRCNGALVRRLRHECDLRQKDLAALAGWSLRVIQKAEGSRCVDPSLLHNLSELFSTRGRQVTFDELRISNDDVVSRLLALWIDPETFDDPKHAVFASTPKCRIRGQSGELLIPELGKESSFLSFRDRVFSKMTRSAETSFDPIITWNETKGETIIYGEDSLTCVTSGRTVVLVSPSAQNQPPMSA